MRTVTILEYRKAYKQHTYSEQQEISEEKRNTDDLTVGENAKAHKER